MTINVMVNGLSADKGAMAKEVAKAVHESKDLNLVMGPLTGPEVKETRMELEGVGLIDLYKPNKREDFLSFKKSASGDVIYIDFVKDPKKPKLPHDQVKFYCENNLPFVMGSVGGDPKTLENTVKGSEISAVIAPNMAKQIVALQTLIEDFSEQNPHYLEGCSLNITESHQKSKGKETSGTAKAKVKYYNALGIPFNVDQIKKIRDEDEQLRMGVPKEHLGGHGWHTYCLQQNEKDGQLSNFASLVFNFLRNSEVFNGYNIDKRDSPNDGMITRTSPDGNVSFSIIYERAGNLLLTHNVNGRSIYADGTLDGIRFLQKRIDAGEKGKVYSMKHVLEGN